MIRVAMTSELTWQRNDAVTYFTCGIVVVHENMNFGDNTSE